MQGYGLNKHYQGGALLPWSPLKRVKRKVKLRLPCQILGQHQSGPPVQPLSCWGRSLGHSIGCLTAQMATQCLRL